MAKAQLLEQAQEHQSSSEKYLETRRQEWPDYESMFFSHNREALQSNSKVYDPMISTIEIERTARVMAQNPSGQSKARSRNDVGKNLLMNLTLNYQQDTANEQWSYLIKMRMLSLYSRIFGSMYALVPWRVTPYRVGPELNIIHIWDAYPQPNKQMNDAEWFIQKHRTMSVKWLMDQAKKHPEVWEANEIFQMAAEMKRDKDGGDVEEQDTTSPYTQDQFHPSQFEDVAFPQIEAFTEYQRGMWITWTPKRVNSKHSRPHILRILKPMEDESGNRIEVYPEGLLPVVVKHSVPLLDSPIGLGPFQRGKSVQFAANSLINLHLEGVKTSVRPELMMNPNNVVPSTIKFGAAEKWFMNTPGNDIIPLEKNREALGVFNSTYGLFRSIILNQGGTTDTTSSQFTESSLGKTPEAIRTQQAAQQTQDEWEMMMIEDTEKQIKERWIALNTHKMEAEQMIRVFGPEIEAIKAQYPDATEIFDTQVGQVRVSRESFTERDDDQKKVPIKFDYDVDTGSTSKPNINQETEDLVDLFKMVTENPQTDAALQAEGTKVSKTELLKRIMLKKGVKDYDQVVKQADEGGMSMGGQVTGEPVALTGDADIDRVANEIIGGANGVPTNG